MKEKNKTKPILMALALAMVVATGALLYKTGNPNKQNTLGQLPLFFEENIGQTDKQVKFLTRGPGYTMFLTQEEAVIKFRSDDKDSNPEVLTLKMNGAEERARVSGIQELPAKANYLKGGDPKKWRTGVSTFQKVKYEDLYPGIDVVYYGNQGRLEYDFIVEPGADYKTISMTFQGSKDVRIDKEGSLVIRTEKAEVIQKAPFVYQEINGQRKEIASNYVIKENRVGFEVAAYDTQRPLVIDPILLYGSYVGGSSYEGVNNLAVASNGRLVLAGDTASLDFPTNSPLYAANQGNTDVFVMEFKANGRSLEYSTYIGGISRDRAFAVATADDGSTYVTGESLSSDFPVTAGAYQATRSSGADVFLLKLKPKGKAIEYSTFLGGTGNDIGLGLVVAGPESVLLSGRTSSTNFPVKNAVQAAFGGYHDAFLAKVDTSQSGASSLVYSTYIGGSDWDEGLRVDVDAAGNAYVVGDTASTDFPTTAGAFQEAFQTYPSDVFVTKIAADGSAVSYSTLVGSPLLPGDDPLDVWKEEEGWAIAVDDAGHAYITGFTDSGDFPVTAGAYNSPSVATPGNDDVFITKLSLDGSSLVYSAMIGGSNLEKGAGIALDEAGSPYITGWTTSSDLPVKNQYQSVLYISPAAYVTKLTPDGTDIVYSTYYGGYTGGGTRAWNIVVDSCENAYFGGETSSYNIPRSWDAFQDYYGGGYRDGFIAQFQGVPNCSPAAP